MSLKLLHIVFIVLATLLAFGFSAWEVRSYLETHDLPTLFAAVVAFCIGAVLILYGRRFLKKLKGVSYL
jgi:hypothetical protein